MNLLSLLEIRSKQAAFSSREEHRDNIDAFRKYYSYITVIFRRACVMYPADEIMWKTALDFCIKYNVKVRDFMDRALKLHPHSEDLWLICAKWYAEFSGEIKVARNMLQRAIRICPASEKLWANFFRMECYLALPTPDEITDALEEGEESDDERMDFDGAVKKEEKTEKEEDDSEVDDDSSMDDEPKAKSTKTSKARRGQIVMEDESEDDDEEDNANENDDSDSKDENGGLTELEQDVMTDEEEKDKPATTVKSRIELINNPEQLYAVPLTIMDEVCKNTLFKDNVSVRFALLDVLKTFPRTKALQERLLQNVISNFSDDENALFKCITFHYDTKFTPEQLKTFLTRVTELVTVVQTGTMWGYLMSWCLNVFEKDLSHQDRENEQLDTIFAKQQIVLNYLLQTVYKESNKERLVTPHMVCELSNFLFKAGATKKALKLTSEAVKLKEDTFAHHVPLLIIHLRNLCSLKKHKKARAFIKRLTKPGSSSDHIIKDTTLWDAITQYTVAFVDETDVIESTFKLAMRSVPEYDNVRRQYLHWAYLNGGVSKGREARRYIISLHPAPLSTFMLLLDTIEQMEGITSQSMDEVFETALLDHGKTSAQLWMRYIGFLRATKRASMLGVIRQRALTTLNNVAEFEELETAESMRDL